MTVEMKMNSGQREKRMVHYNTSFLSDCGMACSPPQQKYSTFTYTGSLFILREPSVCYGIICLSRCYYHCCIGRGRGEGGEREEGMSSISERGDGRGEERWRQGGGGGGRVEGEREVGWSSLANLDDSEQLWCMWSTRVCAYGCNSKRILLI